MKHWSIILVLAAIFTAMVSCQGQLVSYGDVRAALIKTATFLESQTRILRGASDRASAQRALAQISDSGRIAETLLRPPLLELRLHDPKATASILATATSNTVSSDIPAELRDAVVTWHAAYVDYHRAYALATQWTVVGPND